MGLKGGEKENGIEEKIRKMIFARIIENGNEKEKELKKRNQKDKKKKRSAIRPVSLQHMIHSPRVSPERVWPDASKQRGP